MIPDINKLPISDLENYNPIVLVQYTVFNLPGSLSRPRARRQDLTHLQRKIPQQRFSFINALAFDIIAPSTACKNIKKLYMTINCCKSAGEKN